MAGKKDCLLNVTTKNQTLDKFTCKLTCCKSCSYCRRAATKERRKSRYCSTAGNKICERCFVFRSLGFCPKCHKCPKCWSRSTCRLHQFWETWAALGVSHKVITVLREVILSPSGSSQTDKVTHHLCYISRCFTRDYWFQYPTTSGDLF